MPEKKTNGGPLKGNLDPFVSYTSTLLPWVSTCCREKNEMNNIFYSDKTQNKMYKMLPLILSPFILHYFFIRIIQAESPSYTKS